MAGFSSGQVDQFVNCSHIRDKDFSPSLKISCIKDVEPEPERVRSCAFHIKSGLLFLFLAPCFHFWITLVQFGIFTGYNDLWCSTSVTTATCQSGQVKFEKKKDSHFCKVFTLHDALCKTVTSLCQVSGSVVIRFPVLRAKPSRGVKVAAC